MYNKSKVRLPEWIWEQTNDENELKQLILEYMERYPEYRVLQVVGRIAICEIHRQ